MEKRTPHNRLEAIQSMLAAGRVRMTFSAIQGARALGLDEGDVLEIVGDLARTDFRKSMTTYADHRIWQDVYCTVSRSGPVYLKLSVLDELLVVSFKEA